MKTPSDKLIERSISNRTAHCRMRVWECNELSMERDFLSDFHPVGLYLDGNLKFNGDEFVVDKETFERLEKSFQKFHSFVESELEEWAKAWLKSKKKDYKRYLKARKGSGKFLQNEEELNKYVDRQARRQRHK